MYETLKNKTILLTGATGLIGQSVVRRLLLCNARVVALVRNPEKAEHLFGKNKNVIYIVSDVINIEPRKMNIDYIIHAASITSSKAFVEDPLDVIDTAIIGTRNILEISRLSQIKGFLYLSSMEVYGTPTSDEKVGENNSANLNTMSVRSAYPESKRMCENLCASYASKYNVPTKVIRLTQTFGPGVDYNDSRVFAEFARCAIEKKNIVLQTKGETKRSYLYIEDAVDAILTVLIKGRNSEAYNAANEETYCSIYDMAELVAKECADGSIRVIVKEKDVTSMGYAPTLHINLDTKKLRELGWKAQTGLKEMFTNMISDMKKQQKI